MPLSNEEKARPIMQYVSELENKVRMAKGETNRWKLRCLEVMSVGSPLPFLVGVMVGVGLWWMVKVIGG